MNIRTFYKIAESPSWPRTSTEVVVTDIKAELAKLKEELGVAKDARERNEISRKITRLEIFDRLQSDTSQKEAVAVSKILSNKTSENYLWSDLLALKRRGVDIVPLVLVNEASQETEITSTSLSSWQKFTVNFGANKHLNAKIGAGDILPIEVTQVQINGTEWTRRNSPRPGYYDSHGKYLPIFDGDRIEIVAKWSIPEADMRLATEAGEKRWAYLRANDMIDYNKKNPITDLEEDRSLFSEVTRVTKEREELQVHERFQIESRRDFAEKLIPLCKEVASKNGIPWQVMFWQAALESGWWKSQLTQNYNNFFWIKSHWWGGKSVTMRTAEEGANWLYYENASFRVYSSPEEGLQWYVDFLKQNPRYRNAFRFGDDPVAFLNELKAAKYATDSNYVSKVQQIWERYS